VTGRENFTFFKLKGRGRLGDQDVAERIILKQILRL
jgi:hypothetical protein